MLSSCGGGGGTAPEPPDAADALGGHDAASDPAPELNQPPPSCASILWPDEFGALPLSNTLRLSGGSTTSCAEKLALKVTLDGRTLAPVAAVTVPPEERYDLAWDGSWKLATNLWCPLGEGWSPEGPHVLRAALVDEASGREITFREAVASFAGADADLSVIPFVPGAPRPPGMEYGNAGPGPEVRSNSVRAMVDGASRNFDYEVTLPPGYSPATPLPLLILMHGWSRNADDFRQFPDASGMRAVAAARGFILASPQGHWHDAAASVGAWGCLKNQCEIREGKNWYTPVFQAFLADVLQRYSVDTRRVHVAGFSCGASFAYCLAVNFPGKFASATVMDGNQIPINTVAFGPYGYFPNDQRRRIPLKIITGAARKDWEARYGPKGNVGPAFCMDVAYAYSGKPDHTWFASFNEEIADFVAAARVP